MEKEKKKTKILNCSTKNGALELTLEFYKSAVYQTCILEAGTIHGGGEGSGNDCGKKIRQSDKNDARLKQRLLDSRKTRKIQVHSIAEHI